MKKIYHTLFLLFCFLFMCDFSYALEKEEYSGMVKNPAYTEYIGSGIEQLEYYKEFDYDIYSYASKVSSSLPNSYSSKDYGYTPSMDNQGNTDLCWAYTGNNVIETYLKKYTRVEYDFSEKQLGYLAYNYGDATSITAANNLSSLLKYWYEGYGPVLSSKFDDIKNPTISDYKNSNNISVDINSAIIFDYLDIVGLLNSTKSQSDIENAVMAHVNIIKEQIYNYGAVYSMTDMDSFNKTGNYVFDMDNPSVNPDDFNYQENGDFYVMKYSKGHALTVIGWDDNKAEVTYNGKTYKGAWLVMNSWGQPIGNDIEYGSHYDYFYVSYYDGHISNAMMGVTSVDDSKDWDHVYKKSNKVNEDLAFVKTDSRNDKEIWTFKVGENEVLTDIKIYFNNITDKYTNIRITSGSNIVESLENYKMHIGINGFSFDNINLEDTITIEVFGVSRYYYTIELFTSNINYDEELKTMGFSIKNRILFSDISKKTAEEYISDFTASSYSGNVYNNNYQLIEPNNYVGTGSIIKFCKESVCKNYKLVVSGDVNGDGNISSKDYGVIKNHIMEKSIIEDEYYKLSADYNNDGEITSKDYGKIKNYIMYGGN